MKDFSSIILILALLVNLNENTIAANLFLMAAAIFTLWDAIDDMREKVHENAKR